MIKQGISVVLPSYNAAGWLPTTIQKIERALINSGVSLSKTEIIVVDDGSSDDTVQVVSAIAKKTRTKVRLITQKNQGRYLTRKNGVAEAKYEYIWFVDSRVHVTPNSLKYVVSEIEKDPKNIIWNAHVIVQKTGNIIARFMDAITFIGWRKYFKKPRRTSYGLKEFDHYPKGTTSFFVPKNLIVSAMEEFEQEEHDMQRSSDDTHLIRILARDHRINLSPKFSCLYHARNTFKAFVKHSYHRGQVFIDGFFRPGTRFFVPLLLFFALCVGIVAALIAIPALLLPFMGLFATGWLLELIAALALGVAPKDALSLFLLTPVFAVVYGAGLWVAVIKRFRQYLTASPKRSNIFAAIIALLFFAACTSFYYLGNSIYSCADTLATGPGDQTGLVWLNSTVNAPLWGPTHTSNAPYGEGLFSPVHVAGALEYSAYWFVALFVGPVCGYNLFTALGLIASAMVVFFLTRSLTRRNDVAVFAGFAASFTPYIQIKTGVHPSYVFYGVFVLAVWLAIRQWYKPSIKKAIGLGLVISTFFYIDPYFTLLGGVVMGTTFLIMAGRLLHLFYKTRIASPEHKQAVAKARKFIGHAFLSASVVSVCGLLPLAIVKMQNGEQIDKEVSSVRSDIKVEANTYSARPAEYFLPNLNNPYISTAGLDLPDILTRKPHGSNPAEDTLSLSAVVMLLTIITVVLATWQLIKKRSAFKLPSFNRNQLFMVGILAAIGAVAMLTSFPPQSKGITFPSDIITNYITIWRVFARLAIVVMFAMAIVAAIGLALLTSRLRRWMRLAVVALVMIIVGIEYLTFVPFNDTRAWSYNQTHTFYKWLRDQPDIHTIAEYPLNEPGQTGVSVDYFRDQFTHKKRFINAFRAASPQAPMRNGLRDLSDPQTPAALATLGVDLVVVHAEDKKPMPKIDGLEVFDWNHSEDDPDSIYSKGKMWVYKVTAKPDTDNLILVPGAGFLSSVRINSTYTEAGYVFKKQGSLEFVNLKTGTVTQDGCACVASMSIFSDDFDSDISIKQNGVELWRGIVGHTPQEVTFQLQNKHGSIQLEEVKETRGNGIIVSDIDLNGESKSY